jgi:hypothetical protein
MRALRIFMAWGVLWEGAGIDASRADFALKDTFLTFATM